MLKNKENLVNQIFKDFLFLLTNSSTNKRIIIWNIIQQDMQTETRQLL